MSEPLQINFRSLTDIVVAEQADAPLVLRCITPSVPPGQLSTAGTQSNPPKFHTYVRIDGLPKELAERVRTACEALAWG
jgi:hypothetical protein